MKAVKRKPSPALSETAQVLLDELREECENVVRLIHLIEAETTSPRQRDEHLGELSAAVLHLHVHTKGLDEILCETD